ncbi:MAG: glycosyltransferase family 2 protein [Chitinophagaceae bacterium]
MTAQQYKISIVVPVYNEEKGFRHLTERLDAVMKKMGEEGIPVETILVDDGSADNSPMLIRLLARTNPHFKGVLLSRNFGHQIAVTAGIKYATGSEAIFIIDCDLQDPPELLYDFYPYLAKGYDVVYGIRRNRKESGLKKATYSLFYKVLSKISTIPIPVDSGDFSLISRRVADILNEMPEESRFLRGMRSWAGFSQIGIEYDRQERHAGDSTYSFRRLWKLAKDGIYNFSDVPIAIMRRIGFGAILFSLIYFAYILYQKMMYNSVPQGFTTLVFLIMLFAGLQFVFLGVMGEYVLRIFFQVKQRPLFILKEYIAIDESKNIEKNGKEEEANYFVRQKRSA